MIDELKEAIFDYGTANVANLSSSNFFHVKGTYGKTGARCIYQGIDSPTTFDSQDERREESVQFSFYAVNKSALATLLSQFRTAFTFGAESSLSVTGWRVIEVSPELDLGYDKEGDTWVYTIQYLFHIERDRSA